MTDSTANPNPGGPIRTISVSLLTVAAIAASVVVSKARQPRPDAEDLRKEAVEGTISLDDIRQAGF